ncbi:hypothetical protein BASA81_013843 [Batrachochytrium salamandrivorans]|nr:hypothetical protein BASA81_013843 [Batrachochytrium salamandrivorans]
MQPVEEKEQITTNNQLVLVGIVMAACGLAIAGLSVHVKQNGDFYEFAAYSMTILQQTQFVALSGLAGLLLGLAGVVSGLGLAVAGLVVHWYPRLYIPAIVLQIIIIIAHFTAGGVIMQGLQQLDDAIYKPKPGISNSTVGGFASNAVHYELALFNACCAPLGYSKEVYLDAQSPDAIDSDGYVKHCNSLYAENLANIDDLKFRTCYPDWITYQQMNYTVSRNRPRLCQALTEAKVNIEGKIIPGQTLLVSSMTFGRTVLPIVGSNTFPVFGCGAGFAKAFMAIILVWAENVLRPIGLGFLLGGALELVGVVIVLLGKYISAAVGKYTRTDSFYANYMREVEAQKQAAAVPYGDADEHEGGVVEFNVAFDSSKRVSQANPMYVDAARNRASMPRFSVTESKI